MARKMHDKKIEDLKVAPEMAVGKSGKLAAHEEEGESGNLEAEKAVGKSGRPAADEDVGKGRVAADFVAGLEAEKSWDLGQCVERLRRGRRLRVYRSEVSGELGFSARVGNADGRGVLFERVAGVDVAVVSGLCGRVSDLAFLAGVDAGDFRGRIREAESITGCSEAVVVKAASQEVEFAGGSCSSFAKVVPKPRFAEAESGQYLTAGVVFVGSDTAEVPTDTHRNYAIRRLLFLEKNFFALRVESPKIKLLIENARKDKHKIPIAVAVGLHPFFLLASQLSSKWKHTNKTGFAEKLLGKELPFTKARSIPLWVPAHAEMILEGYLHPDQIVRENPVGELAGYYGEAGDRFVVEVTHVTHKKSPLYQIIVPGSIEQFNLNALMRESVLYNKIRELKIDIVDVCFSLESCGRFHARISINKKSHQDITFIHNTIYHIFPDLKQTIIVDGDVDVHSHRAVEWALATRFQADRDIYVQENLRGSFLDPSNRARGFSAAVTFDATIPLDEKNFYKSYFLQ